MSGGGGSSGPHHLVLLQHGNHGAAVDMTVLEGELMELLRDKANVDLGAIHFFRPACNEGLKTHDGIDRLAKRVVADLAKYMEAEMPKEGDILFTLVGHSLGV